MTLHDVPYIAQHLLEKYGLAQEGWKFEWDHAKRRAGYCRYSAKTISLSRHYVTLNVAERLDDIIDTILHEIAHALAGSEAKHGPKWRAVCEQIGARPERCYRSAVISMPKGRFVATCRGCGKQFRRHKREKVGTWRYCVTCGPDLVRLVYEDTTTNTSSLRAQDIPPAPRRMR